MSLSIADVKPQAEAVQEQETAQEQSVAQPQEQGLDVRKLEIEIPESIYEDLVEVLPEKFKQDPQKFVKSYIELEKKIGVGAKPNVPDEYEFDVPEGVEIPDALIESFRNSKLTQEQAQAIVNTYVETVVPAFQQQRIALEQATLAQLMGKSVEEAVAEAESILEWAKNEPDGEALIKAHSSTASGIMYLQELYKRRVAADPTSAPGNKEPKAGVADKILSESQVMELVSDPRYGQDPGYTVQVDRKIQASIEAEKALAADKMHW